MFDRIGIYERFALCHSAATYVELAAILDISRNTTQNWMAGRYPIPWIRLKAVVDEKSVRWDWLIEGREPKHRSHNKKKASKSFDRHGINQRFLSLYEGYSNAKLGKLLGVNGTTVFKWRHDMEQVSWARLKYEVDARGLTWEWFIEGR